jgi:hypothetical protein
VMATPVFELRVTCLPAVKVSRCEAFAVILHFSQPS